MSEPAIETSEVDIARKYIRIVRRLETAAPNEYRNVPEILKRYSNDEIDQLTKEEISVLRQMNALPTWSAGPVTDDDLFAARTYIRTLRKLKENPQEYAKVPAVLRSLSDDEVENLNPPRLLALQSMNVFPNAAPQPDKQAQLNRDLEAFVNQNPELLPLTRYPAQFASHPKIVAWLQMHPEYQRMINNEVTSKVDPFTRGFLPSSKPDTTPKPYQSVPYGTQPNEPPNPTNSGLQSMLGQMEQLVRVASNPFRWLF